ncbi:hypothetical protein CTAYLR_010324 [Chrysophaeum taylorii]|uniref:non-specific serine/threonine protein kinase n=1 Tax=Chrysophaeum taylorii TaxID=2483200 RepID=A0AAD7UJR4_9STRA|nr:hypothetical protein CTAYLR_010324 [Chrysophaeum taylorii]
MEQLEPIKVLGEGAFGKVYLMRHKVERQLVCVKVIKVKNIPRKEREACRMEVALLKRLNHPNIVGYRDSFLAKNKESLCIVMQFADGGDLAAQIKQAAKQRKLFGESKILHWFVQMALGLHYMHSNRVLHRDLKTQNIFLLGNGRLVLGDLGISKVLEGTMDFAQTCIGTPYYMSPEIFKNKPYNQKSDIWALGCVLYEMTTLNHAFDANSLNGLACKIIKGRYPPIATRYSKHLRDLIGAMLSTAPSQRPHLEVVLRRPFVKKHIKDFMTDIVSRPTGSVGEGTMQVRAAVVGVAGCAQQPGIIDVENSEEAKALRAQLDALQLNDIIAAAFAPKEAPTSAVQAEKAVREQASALRREEERRKAVEAALEKLRKEREQRLRDRDRLRAEAQRRAAARMQHPSDRRYPPRYHQRDSPGGQHPISNDAVCGQLRRTPRRNVPRSSINGKSNNNNNNYKSARKPSASVLGNRITVAGPHRRYSAKLVSQNAAARRHRRRRPQRTSPKKMMPTPAARQDARSSASVSVISSPDFDKTS